MPLVPFVVKRYINIRKQEENDIFQIAYMGLWKACKYYKENSKFKFSTFAIKCIKNEIFQYSRKQKKQKDTMLFCDIDENYIKNIPAPESCDISEMLDVNTDYILKNLTEEEQKLLLFKVSGKKQKEIANDLNLAKTTVTKKYKKLREKILDIVETEKI